MSLMLLTCRRVPGTPHRVHVASPLGAGETSLQEVRRVLGARAADELRRRGSFCHLDHADQIWYALVCLGCPVRPDDFAGVAVACPPEPPPDLTAARGLPPAPVACPGGPA